MKSKKTSKKSKAGRKPQQSMLTIVGEKAGLSDKQMRHYKERFKVKQKRNEDGSIDIKLIPDGKTNKDRMRLQKKLAEKLAPSVDVKALLEDCFEDTDLDTMKKIETALDRGATVKPREGCFYLQIKDPLRKKPIRFHIRK